MKMENSLDQYVNELSLSRLAKVSILILCTSFIIDSSHLRSFPSYNAVIGSFGLYCAHFQSGDSSSIINTLSYFIFTCILSLLIDILYCVLWAREILDSGSKSTKFSLALFILTLFIKLSAVYYSAIIAVEKSTLIEEKNKVEHEHKIIHGKESSHRVTFQETTMALSPVYNLEESQVTRKMDSFDMESPMLNKERTNNTLSDMSNSDDLPLPPFSPGVPGLISPYPRKLSPRPPQPPK